MATVFESLLRFIIKSKITFKHVHHQPTYTSQESAQARGESLDIGAKAMIIKLDDEFSLFVVSASQKLDSKKIKALTGCRSIRFATPEELFDLTGLVPGSVPPFGTPMLPFNLYVDESIRRLSKVAFNAGSLTDSLIIKTDDYLRLSNGTICSFSQE